MSAGSSGYSKNFVFYKVEAENIKQSEGNSVNKSPKFAGGEGDEQKKDVPLRYWSG